MITLTLGELREFWPNPTCGLQENGATCKIENIRQISKKNFEFTKVEHDSSYYKDVIVSGILNFIPTDFLAQFNNVESLKMDSCKLLKIESRDLIEGTKLKSISFYDNLLSKIEDFTFHGADQLETISFWKNKIKTVGHLAFYNLNRLTKLDFDTNFIEDLDSNTFSNNVALTELYVHNNRLHNIEFIASLVNLEKLWLHNNRITLIDPHLFASKKNLQDLRLQDNCLVRFDLNLFPVKSVTQLRLFDNYLSELSIDGLRNNFPELAEIHLENNNFECDHLREIVEAVGESRLGKYWKSERTPNVLGILCQDSTVPVHNLEDKCKTPGVNLYRIYIKSI